MHLCPFSEERVAGKIPCTGNTHTHTHTHTHTEHTLLPALLCYYEGCLEGKPAVYKLIQCTLLLVEKAGVALNMSLTFTVCMQVRLQTRELPWL